MPDVRKLKDEAAKAVQRGRHRKGAELYLEVALVEKDDPLWPHRAGEAFKRAGMANEAIRNLHSAAEGYVRRLARARPRRALSTTVDAAAAVAVVAEFWPSRSLGASSARALARRLRRRGPRRRSVAPRRRGARARVAPPRRTGPVRRSRDPD